MDSQRIKQEFEVIKSQYPEATIHGTLKWVFISNWIIPENIWSEQSVTICFQIPENYPGQSPYGFYVSPYTIKLRDGSSADNAQIASDTPYGNQWLKFSWAAENWYPHSDYREGSNLLNFIHSFIYRFKMGR